MNGVLECAVSRETAPVFGLWSPPSLSFRFMASHGIPQREFESQTFADIAAGRFVFHWNGFLTVDLFSWGSSKSSRFRCQRTEFALTRD